MSLSSDIRQSVSHYKLARKVVEQICQSNNLDVATVWSTLSAKDFDGLDRHFRREKRRNDPLSSVKKHRTAFSFFTQANRKDIQLKNPTLSFGAISKIVGEQWKALDEKSRAKYTALETEDKARYCAARQQVMDDMAVNGTASATAPVAEATAPVAEAAAPKKARVAKTAAPAVVSAPAAEAAPVAAKPSKKSVKAAAAPVAAEANAAPSAAPKKSAKAAATTTQAPKKASAAKKH